MNIFNKIKNIIEKNNLCFNKDIYSNNVGINFPTNNIALEHWNSIGKKNGVIYNDKGEHTLLKIIIPTLNDGRLLELWLKYYEKLIGLNNIIIFDNNSTEEYTLKVYEKYEDKIFLLYKTAYYFDIEFNKDPNFNIIINMLKNECKYLSKIDTDEFLCYYDKSNNIFDNKLFINYLINSENDIGSIWNMNIYNESIHNNCYDYNNWTNFENIDYNNCIHDFNDFYRNNGKMLYLTNKNFQNTQIAYGNHNRHNKNKNIQYGNVICLHFTTLDLDKRYENNVATIMKEQRKKNYFYLKNEDLSNKEILLEKFKNISNDPHNYNATFHKANFNYNYLQDGNFKKSYINNTVDFKYINVIKKTIDNF